jgi:hypothetical protein
MKNSLMKLIGGNANYRKDSLNVSCPFQLAGAGKEIDSLFNLMISAQTMRKIFGIVREADQTDAVAVMIDAERRIVGLDTVFINPYNAVHENLRQIFKIAINTSMCSAIVLGHYHSSGEFTPTIREIMVTWQMVLAAGIMGIDVNDHLIVSQGSPDYYSFYESGELDRMRLCVESMLKQFEIIE